MTEHPSIRRAYAAAAARDPGETCFLQALETLYGALAPCLEEQPQYAAAGLLERLGEPERAAAFPVLWTDGQGVPRQARGFFVQYSTALGPCRGGLMFRSGLDMAAAKALALEAALESSLAGLPLGGGFFGADISPVGWEAGDSLRFCRSFMQALYPFLPRSFHPADWTGLVPRRELDFLTGQYERLAALIPCPPDRTAPAERGPMTRHQAAGHGLCSFAELALRRMGLPGLEGQTVLISGRDGPAAWAGERAVRMGAQVVALGDGTGCLYAPGGLPLATLRRMAAQPGLPLLLWAIRAPGVEYRPGPGLWDIPADTVFLCDGRTRLDVEGARRIVSHRPAGVFEAVPRACTALAARTLAAGAALYSPAIASGAGGALMAFRQQNAHLTQWEAARLLRAAMEDIYQAAWNESVRAGRSGDLDTGARIAAFRRIADAILAKGL